MPPVRVRVPSAAGKVRVAETAGKAATKARVRAKRAGKAQPLVRCITGYCCSNCKPDYNMALAMGMHGRLGQASPLADLTDDLLRKIIEATKPRRTLPAWMSCSFNLKEYKALQATRESNQVCSTDPKD